MDTTRAIDHPPRRHSVADQIAVRKASSTAPAARTHRGRRRQALDYLYRRGSTRRNGRPGADPHGSEHARIDGEVLATVKADPDLRDIPCVWSPPREEDIAHCYGLGGNSFVASLKTPRPLRAVLHIENFGTGRAARPRAAGGLNPGSIPRGPANTADLWPHPNRSSSHGAPISRTGHRPHQGKRLF